MLTDPALTRADMFVIYPLRGRPPAADRRTSRSAPHLTNKNQEMLAYEIYGGYEPL